MLKKALNPNWSRRLWCIDTENLADAPQVTAGQAQVVAWNLNQMLPISPMDIVYVAANPGNAFACHVIARELGGSIHLRHGKDGAEKALLDVVLQLPDSAFQYSRCPITEVVICSGDHFFVEMAQQFNKRGQFVRVISRKESLSRSLARSAHDVMYLDDLKKI